MAAARRGAYIVTGRYEFGERLRDALARCKRAGLSRAVSTTMHLLGIVLYRLGRYGEAEAAAREALAGFRLVGDERMEAGARVVLAALRSKTDADGAAAELEALLAAMPDKGLPWRAYASALLAELRLARGDVAGALDAVRPAFEAIDAAGAEAEIFVRLTFARALDTCGEAGRARAELAAARDVLMRWASFLTSDEDRAALFAVDDHRRVLDLARDWQLA